MGHSKSKKRRETRREMATRTAQHCAQCTAHGKIALLKGHKKLCPFTHCRCVHCMLVNNKRQIMAKQVKLKRLQEKAHSRRRRGKDQNKTTDSRSSKPAETCQEKKLAYLDGAEINEMQHCQEENWRVICAQSDDMQEQSYHVGDQQESPSCARQWSPINSVQYNHPGHFPYPLHNASSGSLMFQPCYPVTSSPTPINYFATPVGESELFPLNHVYTQPVFYQYIQPECPQNIDQTNPLSAGLLSGNSLQPLEVVETFEAPANIAAAETLLTLYTGEE